MTKRDILFLRTLQYLIQKGKESPSGWEAIRGQIATALPPEYREAFEQAMSGNETSGFIPGSSVPDYVQPPVPVVPPVTIATLETENALLKVRIKEAEDKLVALEAQSMIVAEEAEAYMSMLRMTVEYELEEYKSLKKNLEEQRALLEVQQREDGDARQTSELLQQQLLAAQEIEASLRAELASAAYAAEQADLHEQRISALAEQATDLERELEEARQEYATLQARLQSTEQELTAKLQSAEQELKAQLQTAEEALKAQLQSTEKDLQSQLRLAEAEKQEATLQLMVAEQEKNVLSAEIEALRRQIEEMSASAERMSAMPDSYNTPAAIIDREAAMELAGEVFPAGSGQPESFQGFLPAGGPAYEQPATAAGQDDLLKKSLMLTNSVTTHFFDVKTRLSELFSDSMYISYPDEHYNGNFIFITEKFGLVYMVLVKAIFEGLEGQTFAMASNFILNDIIRVRKFVNPSRLIEEYIQHVRGALPVLEDAARYPLQAGACLIDQLNYEVEYAGTSFPVYAFYGHTLESIRGGLSSAEEQAGRRYPGGNKYKVHKIKLMKGSSLFLSSLEFEHQRQLPNGSTETLGEAVKAVARQPHEARQERLLEFFRSYATQQPGKPKDFLLTGLTF